MLNKTGVACKQDLDAVFPEEKLLIKPKALIECYEEIPCNPCSTCCPVNAIHIEEDINHRPVIDYDVCTGCGICVYHCPALAISVVSIKEDRAYFKIPYELHPLPTKGEVWDGVNRAGEVICEARVEQVAKKDSFDKTALITVSVDKAYLYQFITIRKKP